MKGFADQFCRCHWPRPGMEPPVPEPQIDGNGKVVAILCKRCTLIISCDCPKCGERVEIMWDHVKADECPKKTTPRQKKVEDKSWLPGVPR